ncbi:MAG: SCO family protein [Pseudomonadota bacterium]
MKPIRVLLLSLSFFAVAAGVLVYLSKQPGTPDITTATMYAAPQAIADFALVDTAGQPVGREFFQGQWDMVFFGFTNCPDICPVTLQILSNARKQIDNAGLTPLPRIVLVSVDPERDTPEKLSEYIGYFGDGIAGLTGPLPELRSFTLDLGVFFQKADNEGGAEFYNVDHSAVVLLIDPEARVRGLYSAPQRADLIAADYPGVLAL